MRRKKQKKNRSQKPVAGKFTVDLNALQDDLDTDISALQSLQQQIERKRKKLAAARLLAPEIEQAEEAEQQRADRRPNPAPFGTTWTEAIMAVVNGKTEGISYQDLLREIQKRFALPVSKGAKGFYNAIKRLHDDEKIAKRGGLVYTQGLVQALERSGQPLPVRQVDRGGSVTIVLDVLRQNPNGLPAPSIKQLAGKHPDAPRSIREHNHYIYNVLASLVKRGRITRARGIYRIAEQVVQPALH